MVAAIRWDGMIHYTDILDRQNRPITGAFYCPISAKTNTTEMHKIRSKTSYFVRLC